MDKGYDRGDFTNFMADYKRASRHMLHTCQLAEKNGVAPEALASVCLEVAAQLMARTHGSAVALETLQMTVERINKNSIYANEMEDPSLYH